MDQKRDEAKRSEARSGDSRQARIEAIVAPTIDAMGYELVRVMIFGQHRPTVQIMAERKDGVGMSVEDCEAISRVLSAKLDVEDPLPNAYTLEISSPGIDRPLTRLRDFARFAGHLAKVETRTPQAGGQRRFTGRILGTEEATVRIALAEGNVDLPFAEIQRAKLVLTEELIRAGQGAPTTH
jgi:ribosome maturation factor RimP